MPKNMDEVRAKLAEHFPADRLDWKNGFAYVPWDDAMRLANDIFGAENVDVELLQPGKLEAVPNPDGSTTYGYSAVVRVGVTVTNRDTGGYMRMFRDGQGFNELEFTSEKVGRRKDGSEYRIPPRALIDTAIKGAASGALLRALTLFGDAFGLYLYNKALREEATGGQAPASSAATPRASSSAPRSTNGRDLGPRPSEKQMTYLAKAGITEEQLETMEFKQWKQALDDYFANTPKTTKRAPARSAVTYPASVATADDGGDEGDDLPF